MTATRQTPKRAPRFGALSLAAGVAILSLGAGHWFGRVQARDTVIPAATTVQAATARTESRAAALPVPSYADVVEPAMAAVVSVDATRTVKAGGGDRHEQLRRYFGVPLPDMPDQFEQEASGSGVVVRSDGVILTNNHVVDDAKEVTVRLADQRQVKAKVLGTDPATDLAVIKVDLQGLPALPFGASGALRIGDVVFAIGNPFNVGQTVTMGIVSAKQRDRLGIVGSGAYEDFIQTDAAINPGNSGGALVNARGELVGINTAIISRGSPGNMGIGFAVPVDMASRVMDQILAEGKVTRAQLGVMIQGVDPALAKHYGLDHPEGALVTSVLADSPAERAGLEVEDLVLEVDGQRVANDAQLRLNISSRKPGSRVRLGILRDGQRRTIDVTLGAMNAETASTGEDAGDEEPTGGWGIAVADLDDEARRELELDADVTGAVVTRVVPASPASRAGLRRGDVVLAVDGKSVGSAREARQLASAEKGDTLLLKVRRGEGTLFVALER